MKPSSLLFIGSLQFALVLAASALAAKSDRALESVNAITTPPFGGFRCGC